MVIKKKLSRIIAAIATIAVVAGIGAVGLQQQIAFAQRGQNAASLEAGISFDDVKVVDGEEVIEVGTEEEEATDEEEEEESVSGQPARAGGDARIAIARGLEELDLDLDELGVDEDLRELIDNGVEERTGTPPATPVPVTSALEELEVDEEELRDLLVPNVPDLNIDPLPDCGEGSVLTPRLGFSGGATFLLGWECVPIDGGPFVD